MSASEGKHHFKIIIKMFEEKQKADIENRLSRAEKEWLLATDNKKK